MARTIQSPGVEIREIDFSLRPASVVGTSVFVAGFSDQGPIDEVLQPGSISEFESIYGTPTNAAEQYFYHTAKAVLNSPARLITTRLPYGSERGDGFESWRYSALAYPCRPVTTFYNLSGVSRINVTGGGGGYETAPNATLSASPTDNLLTAAQLLVQLNSTGGIKRVEIPANGLGSGYLTPPSITPSNGTGVVLQAVIGDKVVDGVNIKGRVTAVNVLNSGSGVDATTTLTFTAPTSADGTPETVTTGYTVVPGYTVNTITVSVTGAGYTVPPLVQITGGNGTGATANAVLGRIPDSSQVVTNTTGFSGANVYLFGRPTHIELSSEQYQDLINGNIDWSNTPASTDKNNAFTYDKLKGAGLIIVNRAQTTVNNNFEGYYVGVLDNNNNNPATPFNGILSVEGVQTSTTSIVNYLPIPKARLNFPLSATKFGDGTSVSEVMENLSNVDLNTKSFDDSVSLGLFKLRKSIFTPDTVSLDYGLAESYVGSLDYHRTIGDQTGGPAKTFYIGELAEKSPNIRVIVNPHLSNRYKDTWVGLQGNPEKKVRFLSSQLKTKFNTPGYVDTDSTYLDRVGTTQNIVEQAFDQLGSTDSLFTLGVYSSTSAETKEIGSLVKKLERGFELVDNYDVYQINLACEAGLGTIYVNSLAQGYTGDELSDNISAQGYRDSVALNSLSSFYTTNFELNQEEATTLRGRYTSIANVFINAAERQRKDFMVILDPLRNIFVQGANAKIINTKKLYGPNAGVGGTPTDPGYSPTNFSQHIYWPLRHLFGTINSSYATTYATWAQVVDPSSNKQIWVPFSGFAAGLMANTDFNFQPWFAPAGFTRGIITGVNDIGVYPKQKQRDQLYKVSINPVAFFPAEGFAVFGQKTLLKKPSAFDRINVRRLFLNLEVAVRDTMKFFVFEPNTLFTRTQVINTLSPIFDLAKNTEGLYDYLIVCDERNNTPDVIDNNELKVDIYIKPVRTAEFILVSFYATRTNQNFQELVGGA